MKKGTFFDYLEVSFWIIFGKKVDPEYFFNKDSNAKKGDVLRYHFGDLKKVPFEPHFPY